MCLEEANDDGLLYDGQWTDTESEDEQPESHQADVFSDVAKEQQEGLGEFVQKPLDS